MKALAKITYTIIALSGFFCTFKALALHCYDNSGVQNLADYIMNACPNPGPHPNGGGGNCTRATAVTAPSPHGAEKGFDSDAVMQNVTTEVAPQNCICGVGTYAGQCLSGTYCGTPGARVAGTGIQLAQAGGGACPPDPEGGGDSE